MDKLGIILVFMVVAIVSGIAYLVWSDIKDRGEFRSACEARGGIVVSGRDIRLCVDPGALR